MITSLVIFLSIFGHLSSGVPLEDPSADYGQFFDTRIVGGTDAPIGSAPYMVALLVGNFFICGGSIVAKNFVLTAAHCISLTWGGEELINGYHGIVGSNIWHKGTVVEFKQHYLHPKYDPWHMIYDIALLKTKRNIQMNDRVAPIRLNYDLIGGGVKCHVSGWGTQILWGATPEKLQFLNVSTISHKECVTAVNIAAGVWGGAAPLIDPVSEICTFHSINHGMCHGDSGSALKCTGVQVGVVSWGFPCAIGAPDVYGSVHGGEQFLKKILGTKGDF